MSLRSRALLSAEDLDGAVEAFEEATKIVTATPRIWIRSAYTTAELLIGRNNSHANVILQYAVKLMPTIVPRTLNQSNLYYNIS